MSDLPEWIAEPALRPAWDRIRVRFEKSGLRAAGRVQVPVTTRQERHALGDLLGRRVAAERVRIDLAVLDERLAQRSGVGGLGVVLTALYGQAPRDRPAARAARADARERPLALAAELLSVTSADEWTDEWLGWLRATGVLTARADAARLVREAVGVLKVLTRGAAPPSRSRVEIGATLLGDAHALDRDRILHRIVVRGLAAAAGVPMPESSHEVEDLWALFGVQPDLLSRTCLAWRLRSVGDGPTDRRVNDASTAGDPIHLTEWDLRRIEALRAADDGRVLVCENPRVVEAFAERGPAGWSVLCTAGEPNLVVDRVLGQLAGARAELLYHGDFDWAGVAIANRVIARTGARAWLLSAADYLGAVRPDGPPLIGREVAPSWDTELGAAMRNHRRAVHEESVLAVLIEAATRVSQDG